jgi:hypothetical protein
MFSALLSLRQAITPEQVIGRVYGSIGVLGGLMVISGAMVGGWLGGDDVPGPRATVLVAAVGYTVPFLWSLSTPLRDATTEEPVARAE